MVRKMGDKFWVFSYGSNSRAQLQARVQNPNLRDVPGLVEGYERVFCYRSENWGMSGVASLVPSETGRVYGSLAQLTSTELAKLDKFEGGYYKENVLAFSLDDASDEPILAVAYIAANPTYVAPPSEQYLTAIRTMLLQHYEDGHEALSISVRGILPQQVEITTFYQWQYPGLEALSLPALCIEVNARRRIKWVMPKTMKMITESLNMIGINNRFDLIDLITSTEGADHINGKIVKAGFDPILDEEAVVIFRELLGIRAISAASEP